MQSMRFILNDVSPVCPVRGPLFRDLGVGVCERVHFIMRQNRRRRQKMGA